jgi:ATP-dependent exoDNAse (exonuclease V) alpha subunit
MLQRNLLYTGVTRGKRLVLLVGQKKAVAIPVRNVIFTVQLFGTRRCVRAFPSPRFLLPRPTPPT